MPEEYDYSLREPLTPDQIVDRQMSRAFGMPGLTRKRKPKFPPLPAEEEKSVLRQVMDSGIGGLQYIGETLDKPGRAVRGLLGGKPEELLNLIPFSDTMGITNPNESVSGRDLLEKAGVLDKNTPGLDAGDVAGFGAEVLLDPTTYMTFGASAIGKAGKLAKAAGVSLKGAKRLKTLGEVVQESPHLMPALKEAASAQGVDLASMMGEKLGGAMGFTTGPLGLLGAKGSYVPQFAQGERAAALLGGLDNLSAKIGNTGPARAAKMLFNHEVRGQYTPEGQMLGKAQTAASEAMRPKGVEPWLNLRTTLNDIHEGYQNAFGSNVLPEDLADKFERLARMHAEGVASPEAFKFHGLPFHQETSDALAKATADFGGAKDDLWNQFLQLGGNSASMNEYENLKHSPRYLAGEGDKVVAKKSYKGTPDSAKARVEATKYIPADVINTMYRDPEIAEWTKEFSGLNKELGGIGGDDKTMFLSKMKDYLQSKYGKWIDEAAITRKMGPDGVAADLAEHFADRNKAVQFFTKTGQDLYGKFAPDTYKYVTEVSRKVADLSAIHETVGKSLVPGGVPLETLFKDAGMNPTAALETFTKKFGPVGEGMGVAPEVANAVLSVTKKIERPQWLEFINKQVDHITNAFKKNVTQPFPSFLTRNIASGQVMNVAMSGEVRSFKDAKEYSKYVDEAKGLLDDAAGNSKKKPWDYTKAEFEALGGHDTNAYIQKKTGARTPSELLAYYANKYPELKGVSIGGLEDTAQSGKLRNQGVASVTMRNGKLVGDSTSIHLTKDADLTTARHEIEHLLDALHGSNLSGKQEFGRYSHDTFNSSGYLHRSQVKDAIASGIPVSQAVLNEYPELAGKAKSQGGWKQVVNELTAHNVFNAHELQSLGTEIGSHNMGFGFKELPNPISLQGMKANVQGGVAAAHDLAYNTQGEIGQMLPGPLKAIRKAAAVPAEIGAQLNAQAEWMNRVPMYLYLRKHLGWTPEAASAKVRQLQVDYSQLAPFEKDVMKRLVPFYCVPDDTKALTRDGWKTCDEIQVGDELLTYNCDTDRMEWKPCLERAIFEFDGNLSVMANSRHKIRCTDNHRWAVQLQKSGGGFGHSRMLETKDLCLNGRIVLAAPLAAAEDSILTPEQARLLGWLVTDGHWRNRGKHTEAVLYQHPKKFLQEVAAVAGGRPRSPHPDTGVVCVPVLKERVYEIRKYLDKNKLVSVVTRLSRQAAEAMYDAMYKGDGTVGARTSDFLAAENEGVRDAFRVLCAILGRRSSVNYRHGRPRGVVTSKKQHLSLHSLRKWEEKYTGRVWCPRTENGTWVMQQGGLITITGNTYMRKTVPVMLDQMAQRPGGGTAQIVRASNTGRSEGEFVPPYVGEGMSVNLGGDKYLSQLGLPTDQLSELFVKGPTALGTAKRMGQKALSMTSPYLKGPLEVATGQNFFTGRPIEESFKYPTDNVLLNQVLHNSPASRAITTGRKLLDDDRKSPGVKAINALTGLQINDVSGGMEQQQRFAEAKMLAEMLREHPGIGTVTDVYQKTDPKTGQPIKLNPEAEKLLRAYGHVRKLSAEANKKRKKQMTANDG